VRADEGVVLGEVVEDEAEVALNAATGTVGKQEGGATARHEDIGVRKAKRVIGVHAADAKLRHQCQSQVARCARGGANRMRMKEMVRRTGVHERLLRYYEQQGLLTPERLPSGYRIYSESDVETVRRIRSLLAAGLPTSLIAQVLPCIRADDDRLVPTCPSLVAQLRQESERITRAIEELQASRTMLNTVIAAAPLQNAGRPESPRPITAEAS
jgi:DNA-binding transcriptional MerR regulator